MIVPASILNDRSSTANTLPYCLVRESLCTTEAMYSHLTFGDQEILGESVVLTIWRNAVMKRIVTYR